MWKDCFYAGIRNSSTSSLSVRIAAFISALLLSLLCVLFYNAWKYEVERIQLEEGSWHSRILGQFTSQEVEQIRNFAHVEGVTASETGNRGESAVDITFRDKRAVFSETPQIAELLSVPRESIVYHYELLSLYFVRSPGDTAPRLLFPLFLLIALAASFSLIVVIHNSFAVTMNARIHQFGIFSSAGATPRQIRMGLLQEVAVLCAVPVLLGSLFGVGGSALVVWLSNAALGSPVAGRHAASFGCHPLVLLTALLVTVLTILLSAWIPARKLSCLTPLEAIKSTGELQLKRKKNSRLLSLLFGAEGELAGNALKAQKKALRTASLSLVLSFLSFAVMLCVFTLSQISTRETYFQRYQGVWDIMTTVKDTDVDLLQEEASAVQALDGIQSAIVYQRAAAKVILPEDELSEEMKSLGGFSQASAGEVSPRTEGGWLVNAPLVILDDASFMAYCTQLGIAPQLDGAVVLNQIRDVTNPDFRHPVFMPYVKGTAPTSVLLQSGTDAPETDVPILAYTQQVPVLREEYAKIDYYELVHFLPVSLWRQLKDQIGCSGEDSFLCVRAGENATLEELNSIQGQIAQLLQDKHSIEQENRIQEYETNETQVQGMMVFFGGFCLLLALIGVGNVFSNTLGFVRQRRREFARYMSVGLTPQELRKMFCIEALVIAGRPVLITLPVTAAAVCLMLRASYMELGVFLAEAPVVPILVFMLAVVSTVALAYWLGWRSLRQISLSEVLRDDTML